MSYCGCIGDLMADTGIEEILSASFGGVLKLLSGKKFRQNVRAFRMPVEELFRNLLNKHNFQCMDELNKELDAISAKSKTAQLWIDCLIKPVFIILKYIRADTVKEMISLFFCSRSYPLCPIWYNGNFPCWSLQALSRFVQWHMVWYGHWNNIHAIWSWMQRHSRHHLEAWKPENLGIQSAYLQQTHQWLEWNKGWGRSPHTHIPQRRDAIQN